MSRNREKALEIALQYVLNELLSNGLDVDAITEAVSSRLMKGQVSSDLTAEAVIAIEAAADGLNYPV